MIAGLTLLYWNIDMRIRKDILKEKRAEYGEEIVSALRRQLRWTHFQSIIYLDDPLKRDFYAEMFRIENWNTECPSCNSKDCRLISGREFEVKALEVI